MISTESLWIQTRDGHAIDLLAPDLSEVCIEEIAHSLARINRFTGHTRGPVPYSVAQHCVLVANHLPEHLKLAGLLHDAHEAILGDIASPIKWALEYSGGGAAFQFLDRAAEAAVKKRWTAEAYDDAIVRQADLRALATERRDLLGDVQARPWKGDYIPWAERIYPWTIARSEYEFLTCWAEHSTIT